MTKREQKVTKEEVGDKKHSWNRGMTVKLKNKVRE